MKKREFGKRLQNKAWSPSKYFDFRNFIYFIKLAQSMDWVKN